VKNFAEVIEKVRPVLDLDTYVVKPGTNTSLVLDPGQAILRHNGDETRLGNEVIGKFMRRLGISAKLGEMLSRKTLEAVASDLLVQAEPFVVVTQEDVGVGIVDSVNCRPVDIEELLVVIDAEAPEAIAQRVIVDPISMAVSIEVVTEKLEPVVKDDLVQAGALIRFSPIGTIQPLVQAYTSRLVCLNGMTDMRVYNSWKHSGGNGSSEFEEWLHVSVKDAIGSFEGIVERYKVLAMTSISAHDRPAILEALLQEAYMGKVANDAVKAKALEEVPETAWDMVNLVSWATSHIVEEPARIGYGMAAAANFVHSDAYLKSCPVCHQSRR